MNNTHLALVNPPADVQATYSAFVQACQNWHPTEVPNLRLPISQLPPPPPPSAVPDVSGVCHYIQDPMGSLMPTFWLLSLFVVVILFFWITKLHHLPGAVAQIVWRWADDRWNLSDRLPWKRT